MRLIISGLVPAAFALALAGVATPARAGSLDVTALNAAAPPGGTGSFDVTITNNTGAAVDLSGFQLELSVSSGSGVTFTGATTDTTSAYVFAAATSTPPLSFDTFPNTGFLASDTYFALPLYQEIAAGQTFGLAHVSFSVAAGTALGPIAVTVVPYDDSSGGGTLLTDVSGGSIDYAATNGVIQAVPEPSSVVLAVIGGLAAVGGAGRLRRAG